MKSVKNNSTSIDFLIIKIYNRRWQYIEYTIKNDIIFKFLFSHEETLKYFLESLLDKNISEIEVTNQFSLDKIRYNEKIGVLDIKAKINKKDIVNIEMQRDKQKYYMQRILIYTGKLEASQLKIAEEYSQVENVISINILDNIMFEEIDKIHTIWKLAELDNKEKVLDGLEFHFIELPKFRESSPDLSEKLNQWLALIDTENKEWIGVAMENNENIKKAKEKVDEFVADDEARILIELREKWEMDYRSSIASAKEIGHEDGYREGHKIGHKDGRIDGRKEGRKESQKEIARKLLSKGIKIEEIQEITELTKEEIEKLK